jgi:glycine/D-amino acid oxidase-like deaminating enzyme
MKATLYTPYERIEFDSREEALAAAREGVRKFEEDVPVRDYRERWEHWSVVDDDGEVKCHEHH